jgi:hypothetical protein
MQENCKVLFKKSVTDNMATKHTRRLNKLTVYKYNLGCNHTKPVIFALLPFPVQDKTLRICTYAISRKFIFITILQKHSIRRFTE